MPSCKFVQSSPFFFFKYMSIKIGSFFKYTIPDEFIFEGGILWYWLISMKRRISSKVTLA